MLLRPVVGLLLHRRCTMAYSSNSTETYGGSARLSVYNYTDYVYPSSCRVWAHTISPAASPTSRPRVGLSSFTTASTSMTVESCVSSCQTRGYGNAGVERFGVLLRQHSRDNEHAGAHFGLHGDVLYRKFDRALRWLKTTPGVLFRPLTKEYTIVQDLIQAAYGS